MQKNGFALLSPTEAPAGTYSRRLFGGLYLLQTHYRGEGRNDRSSFVAGLPAGHCSEC